MRGTAPELSGAQYQRVAIALNPRLIICDEAVSSLDVVIQAQILSVLERLRAEMQLSCLFIAHDLAMVKQVSDRVMVMYLGRVCEIGSADEHYAAPRHPCAVALLASVPAARPRSPGFAASATTTSSPVTSPMAGAECPCRLAVESHGRVPSVFRRADG